MLTSEQAFDMLPHVADLYDKLNLEDYRKQLKEKYQGKEADDHAVGIEVFKHIFKNSGKIKGEVFHIVAIADGKTVQEIKEQSFTKTIMALKSIFSDKETVDFFRQAMQ